MYVAHPPTGELDGDPPGASVAVAAPLESGDVRRRGALGPFLGVETDLRALGERLEAAALDRAVMYEQVLAGIIGRDETEALVVVEPLHGSCCHVSPSGVCALRDAEGAQKQQHDGTRGTALAERLIGPDDKRTDRERPPSV